MTAMIRTFVALLVLAATPVAAQIKIEEVTSPGGIKAWLVQEPSIPFMALSIGFRGGSGLDPDDRLGVTSFMAGLLEEGAGDMDARAFKEASEALAANFGFDAGRDSVTISAQMLTENRSEALELLRKAIVEPAFNAQAIERVRAQILAGIEQDQQNPQAIASRALNRLAYPDHPYGNPVSGTLESVAAITRDDLVAAHRAALTRDHLLVSAVGDITPEELGPVLDTLFGGLPETGAALPADVDFAATGGTSVIELPTPQSSAVWAQPSITIEDPDFIAAYVMNHILGGGGFGSRLTEEVREKRGLTYGIYSYMAFFSHSAFMGGGVASDNTTIARAIEVVKAEWARMARDGVTEKELELAKKNLTGAYALRFDGNAQIARVLRSMQMDRFPITYVNDRNDRVNALTVEDVNRVARRLLDADALRFVVVGQPEGLRSTD